MPRKSLQGRTCGVSCDGRRARALQPSRRSVALHPIYPLHRDTTHKATKPSNPSSVKARSES
ncbi:hypothetical protein XarzCFBP7410_06450 [Xanthomonas arboricola pv. zantedeschiae]|nr:hypothetical protein XarzCFBP7410_06450 [Xanthomonas arboricola pv. zantedeschiae]